jgi:hypothetical protein
MTLKAYWINTGVERKGIQTGRDLATRREFSVFNDI